MTSSAIDDASRNARRHRPWTLCVAVLLLLAWGAHAAFALPSAPPAVWAEVPESLGEKWFAHVRLAPDGDEIPIRHVTYFDTADRRPTDAWNPEMVVKFDVETPLARQWLQQALRGRHDSWSTVAVYRAFGDTAIAGARTWARHVRED